MVVFEKSNVLGTDGSLLYSHNVYITYLKFPILPEIEILINKFFAENKRKTKSTKM